MGHERPTVAVLSPTLTLTVTIESSNEHDEIHLHPGGQGFWIARMLRHLGERPLLCGPTGGESGRVIRGLANQWAIDISSVTTTVASPTTIQDRRQGDRDLVGETAPMALDRHETDDLYGTFLEQAIAAGVCVVTGSAQQLLTDLYRRLGHDLAASEVTVVADLHGPELASFMSGGPLDVLKISDEDLISDGTRIDADEDSAVEVIARLVEGGARSVVLSRGHLPALAHLSGRWFRATAPQLEPADHRGAGDSQTAGLAAALRQGLGPEAMLRLASGAGATNVTRHGLGSASSDDLVKSLAAKVEVESLAHVGR